MSLHVSKLIRSPITLIVASAVTLGTGWGYLESQQQEAEFQDSLVNIEPSTQTVSQPDSSEIAPIQDEAAINEQNPAIDTSKTEEAIAALTARIDSLVSKNEELEERLVAMAESDQQLTNENIAAADLPEPDAPFTPEALEREARIQNEYIDSIEAIFQHQEEDVAWANEVETQALSKLTTGENAVSEKAQKISGIALESFDCKSQLCNSAFTADSIAQLIEYQNHIINEMVYDLPSVVFGPAEQVGNKFRMRVVLANDDYEFPTMPTL